MPKFISLIIAIAVIVLSVVLSAPFSAPVYAADEVNSETTAESPTPFSGADADQQTTPPPSQSAQPKPKAVAPKPYEYNLKNDINRFFQPDELKQLQGGDSDFYVLFRDDMTGRPKGVALLIPDWGMSTANNRGLEYLRTQLGDYGWVTLSMTVPNSKESVYTTQTSAPVDQPGSASRASANSRPKPIRSFNEQYMEQYGLQLKMRMMALNSEAENYQGYFIVIAQGSSAAVLASLYAKGELPEPEAFILLSAFMPDMALNRQMNQDIAVTAVPTLDIYQERDSRWLRHNVKLRRKLAKKNFKVHYRQKELYGDISYHNQNQRMLKEIYGWLSSMGL
ncbi:MAG: hypothetical protein ACI8WB_000457 [Phenylobacterium sp.]|jgi:hypothetical protein